MSSTRTIIRAFLASPGDLQDERIAVRSVVKEFNALWANELGYQVELIGWEETVSGYGRPQHLINQDLDRCDLFLGMLSKRWGTPPDRDGRYSSGFEEEFERSLARREESGSPEISLFFKEIPEEFMGDPGEDLKKVLAFRERVVSDKKILFKNFSTIHDLESLTRERITSYVNCVRTESALPELDEQREKSTQLGAEEAGEVDRRRGLSPLSTDGFGFLEDLVERLRSPDSLDEISVSDVARFRLLANSISKPGNDEMDIGVHDINILFAAHTKGTKLGSREIRSLTRFGFKHLENENVPIWCWYSALVDFENNPAVIFSFVGADDDERVGAISVLTALDIDLPNDSDGIRRDWLIDRWFSDKSSALVRVAALEYLAKCGNAEDLKIAKAEYNRSDRRTTRGALECMIEILLRTGQTQEAQMLVLEAQFESINADLLETVLEGFDGLDISALHLGLEHRNLKVRLRAVRALRNKNALSVSMAELLSGDSNAQVRSEAVTALLKLGEQLSEEEIKKIFVLSDKQAELPATGWSSVLDEDKEGKELFKQYKIGVLKSLTEAELKKKISESLMHEDYPYFALMERYFKNNADELRRDIDDRFRKYFKERLRRLSDVLGGKIDIHDLLKSTEDLEDYLRKKLTRQGLDILCAARKIEDLQRIRTNLLDGYAGASKCDAEYLEHKGDWSDVHLLANAQGPTLGATILTISSDKLFQNAVAKAITSISKKHSISDLLSLDLPSPILKKTIELCAESRFAKISRNPLLNLLDHESAEVRKAAAIMTVRALPMKQIKSILREYINNKKYRYYNVIHWLDLGASMSRDNAKKVARAACA